MKRKKLVLTLLLAVSFIMAFGSNVFAADEGVDTIKGVTYTLPFDLMTGDESSQPTLSFSPYGKSGSIQISGDWDARSETTIKRENIMLHITVWSRNTVDEPILGPKPLPIYSGSISLGEVINVDGIPLDMSSPWTFVYYVRIDYVYLNTAASFKPIRVVGDLNVTVF